jgi:hypothetical protein
MPRSCTICTHDHRDEIDRSLSDPSRAIARLAAEYRVSEDALSRHKANHLIPEMRNAMALDIELRDVDVLEEMKSLYHRMRQHLTAVEGSDNWKAIQGFHSEARRDLELLAKLLGELDERPVVNLHLSPEWIELRAVIIGALEAHPSARESVLRAIEGEDRGAA